MGCDIHGWVEVKHNDKWVAVKELQDRDRNYQRFASLAGVRGDGPEAKGLPEDVSETAAYSAGVLWDGDAHSESWLPLKDAYKIFEETRYSKNQFYSIYQAFDVEDDDLDKYRLVFWFDN